MENQKIKIGVIGCGMRIQCVLEHLLPSGEGRLEVVALYDPMPRGVEAIQNKFAPAAKVCSSEAELLAIEEIDWVMIGSWNCFHADQVVAALEAGKHIFCEKPLATTLEGCVRIQEAWRKKPDACFFFDLVLRYTSIQQKVKEVIDSGVLGKLVSFEFNETLGFIHGGYIQGNWRRHRQNAGTHVLEKCCHDFDLANWMTGSLPVKAASFGGRDFFIPSNRHLADEAGYDEQGRVAYLSWSDPESVDPFSEGASIVDNQVAILQYANGVRATFHTNCNAAIRERRMYIVGMKGVLRADSVTGRVEVCRVGFDQKPEVVMESKDEGGHYGGDEIMGRQLALTMLGQVPPMATLKEGIESAVSCFGVDAALDSGQVFDYAPLWEKVGVKPR